MNYHGFAQLYHTDNFTRRRDSRTMPPAFSPAADRHERPFLRPLASERLLAGVFAENSSLPIDLSIREEINYDKAAAQLDSYCALLATGAGFDAARCQYAYRIAGFVHGTRRWCWMRSAFSRAWVRARGWAKFQKWRGIVRTLSQSSTNLFAPTWTAVT